jgi:hypothetical protein
MDPANYYITTITSAFLKLAPILAFLIGGYLVFIKLPFLFLRKSMDHQKKKLQEENKDLQVSPEKKAYSVEDYKEFQRKMKLMNSQAERPKLEALDHAESRKKTADQRKEQPKSHQRQEQKTEQKSHQKKEEIRRPRPASSSAPTPEEVLGFRTNECFTKSELKKRYFDKLKENHPDRVASMGEDFKKLAEKNTKEINQAYDKLKNRAA